MSMFKNATALRINLKQLDLFTLEDKLSAMSFEACGASQEKSVGFVPPRGQMHGAYLESVAGQYIARLMIESKSVPGAVVAERVSAEVAKIEASTGRKPGKKERREIAEDVRLGLLPIAFPKRVAVTIWFDMRSGLLWLDSVSQSRIDDVTSMLVKVVDDLQISYVNTEQSPAALMTAWLAHGDELSSEDRSWFDIDRACELIACDESKAVVRYKKHALDTDEIRAHIKQGKVARSLALTWNDRVSFTLADTGAIRSIAFLDVVFEGEGEGNDDLFDTEVAIVTTELRALHADLLEALGGEVTA
ncbi:exonuclease recombination-associated [Curvibacter phage PCA1]|nr:exonuclease recombination-associated [Curvibacter phage PCA1]